MPIWYSAIAKCRRTNENKTETKGRGPLNLWVDVKVVLRRDVRVMWLDWGKVVI